MVRAAGIRHQGDGLHVECLRQYAITERVYAGLIG